VNNPPVGILYPVFELFLMGVGLDFLAVAFELVDLGASGNQKN
jgi:hypothetical protein